MVVFVLIGREHGKFSDLKKLFVKKVPINRIRIEFNDISGNTRVFIESLLKRPERPQEYGGDLNNWNDWAVQINNFVNEVQKGSQPKAGEFAKITSLDIIKNVTKQSKSFGELYNDALPLGLNR